MPPHNSNATKVPCWKTRPGNHLLNPKKDTLCIAVVGGRLQGMEVVYLAKKAGYHTLVIDKFKEVPAAGICDRFVRFEFSRKNFLPECSAVDLIIPAIEDVEVLALIERWARLKQIPLAFDSDAYLLTCSKKRSDVLFETMHIPRPIIWPRCGFPVVVKPDQASGSQGVSLYIDAVTFYAQFSGGRVPDTMVAQQYLTGPQFSIEVIGMPGQYVPLCVTDLHMDRVHDCKRVSTPTRLSPDRARQLETLAIDLAEAIDLKGIMDLEVILHEKDLKLLEIDARFPSQTPMAVYWATGINMVQLLAEQFIPDQRAHKKKLELGMCGLHYPGKPPARWVVLEHIQVSPKKICFLGEHIIGQAGPLRQEANFFGCREALTNYKPSQTCWVATLMFCADSQKDLIVAREACYKQIRENSRKSKPKTTQALSVIGNPEQENQDHDPTQAK